MTARSMPRRKKCWPAGDKALVRTLASAAGKIEQVSLLGGSGALTWTQTVDGLEIMMPSRKPCGHAFALKIIGNQLQPVFVPAALSCSDAQGRIILEARDAEIHGESPRYEQDRESYQIGYWANPKDSVSWAFEVPKVAFGSAIAGDQPLPNTLTLDVGGEVAVK